MGGSRTPTLVALVLVAAAVVGWISGGLVARGTLGAVPIPTATASAAPTSSAAPTMVTGLPDVPAIISSVAPSVVAIDIVITRRIGPREDHRAGARARGS